MTRFYNWLLPHPLLTLLLAVVWTLLQNDVSAGMVVFGVILGIIIPRMTSIWWPDLPKGFHIGKMFSYCLIVMWDILVANIQVAWIVLSVPNAKLKPAWIAIPLKLRQPEAITLLAGTITLTPGPCPVTCPAKATACWCMCCTPMTPTPFWKTSKPATNVGWRRFLYDCCCGFTEFCADGHLCDTGLGADPVDGAAGDRPDPGGPHSGARHDGYQRIGVGRPAGHLSRCADLL